MDRGDALVELLRYPQDTVGGIMTNDVVTLNANLTIREARLTLRDRLRQADFTHFIYVVENDATLVLHGMTRLRDLVVAEDEHADSSQSPRLATLGGLVA